MRPWLTLFAAILAEIVATSALKASDGFRNVGPSILVGVGYGVAFYLLSVTLRTIPVGVAYAIWSGLGIVLISVIAWLFFDQKLDLPAILGIALIIGGVLVIQLFSRVEG